MLAHPIFLDFNATTQVLPEVRDAMLPWLSQQFGNPSSKHLRGAEARTAIEKAREKVSSLIGSQPEELFFTSGGTEASTIALRGFAPRTPYLGKWISRLIPGFWLYLSPADHPASVETALDLKFLGLAGIRWFALDAQGQVDIQKATNLLKNGPGLASVLVAHNESGTLQPVAELASVCQAKGIYLHADGAQAVGKIPCKVSQLKCDLMTIAGHKLGAPQGVGALYIRKGITPRPHTFGGGQEKGIRPGTEPVALIVGLGEAARIAEKRVQEDGNRLRHLRDLLWKSLAQGLGPKIKLITQLEASLPNTLFVSIQGIESGRLLSTIPEVCISTGSACHDGRHQSRLLGAMGIDSSWHTGTLRISLGPKTTAEELEKAASLILGKTKDFFPGNK